MEHETVALPLPPARRGWVQTVRGNASVNGIPVAAGDGTAITGGTAEAELLLFDLL